MGIECGVWERARWNVAYDQCSSPHFTYFCICFVNVLFECYNTICIVTKERRMIQSKRFFKHFLGATCLWQILFCRSLSLSRSLCVCVRALSVHATVWQSSFWHLVGWKCVATTYSRISVLHHSDMHISLCVRYNSAHTHAYPCMANFMPLSIFHTFKMESVQSN